MDYYNPLDKQISHSDESFMNEKNLSGEQIIFPPISGPGPRPPQPGPRPPQPGPRPPQPGPRPPQPGPRPPQPGPRPPQPGPRPPQPGPRPPQPGPRPPQPGPRPPQPGPRPPQPGPRPPQPLAPPPNFIPDLPESTRGPEPFRQGTNFGGSNLWICLNRNTYIWLFNGDNFWFYPTFIGRNHVEGFRWRRNGWTYEWIELRLIFFFLCF